VVTPTPSIPELTRWLFLLIFVLPLSCCTLANDRLAAIDQEHFERGLKYYTDNRLDAALDELNQAVALSPKDAAFLHARANVYYELHDYIKAVNDYSKAIALKPDDAAAYGNRGWSYRHLGQDELAFQDWKTCNRLLSQPPLKPPASKVIRSSSKRRHKPEQSPLSPSPSGGMRSRIKVAGL